MGIEIGNVFKTKNGLYYEVIRTGQYLIAGSRMDKKGTAHFTRDKFIKQVDTIYKTVNEIRIIKNRIREQKLKEQNINIAKFTEMDEKEKYKILENKKIPLIDKVDLIKYDKIDINQTELKNNIESSVQNMSDVIIKVIKQNAVMKELLKDFELHKKIKKDCVFGIEKIKENLKKLNIDIDIKEFKNNMNSDEIAEILKKHNYEILLV